MKKLNKETKNQLEILYAELDRLNRPVFSINAKNINMNEQERINQIKILRNEINAIL